MTRADIIYLQDVFNKEIAYRFFEGLKTDYAHFFLLTDQKTEESTFIASKYPLKNIQFHPVDTFKKNKEGFFDFVVHNDQFSLGHVYILQLSEDIHFLQFERILEKIQRDLLENSEAIPFLLCGNLHIFKNPVITSLIHEYFSTDDFRNCDAFLLKQLPQFFNNIYPHKYNLISCTSSLLNHFSGTLSSIQECNEYSPYSIFRNDKKMNWMFKDNSIRLAGGKASASATQDSNGNSSVEVEVKTSTTTENGNTVSWNASGGISRDQQGKTSKEVRMGVDIEW